MKRVKISELKAHLSEYVAAARGGETVVICDRNTPVAKLEPLDYLVVHEPTMTPEERRKILLNIKPVALLKDVDVHALFDELRADRY